jgi:hypothetical protein
MKTLMIIVHDPSGSVLAACTSDNPRLLDELVDKVIPVVTDDFENEIPIEKADLEAYPVSGDAARVVENPLHYYVVVSTTPGSTAPPQVDFQKAQDTVTLSFAGGAAKINVSSSNVDKRDAWLLVKSKATGDVTPEHKQIPALSSTLTFATTVSSGDAVVAFVAKHRPDVKVA